MIVLTSAALLSASAITMAVWRSEGSVTAATHTAVAVRVEPRVEVASTPRARPALPRGAALAAVPSTTHASRPSPASVAPKSVTAASPLVRPPPVATSKPEPAKADAERRKKRTARAARAASTAPSLPAQLSRAQVLAAMNKVTPAVHACFRGTHGTAKVTFSVIGETGRVVGARVDGKTGKVGSCIARTVRRARFPKFAQQKLKISYPFVR